MDTTYVYLRALHIFGALAWAGSLIGISYVLRQHAKAAEAARPDFVELERGMAMAMDIFATIAIGCGAYLIISNTPIMKSGGWIHAKLTLVVILIGMHGVQRARVAKYKRGEIKPNPSWVTPVVELTILAIIILAAARPF